MFVFYDTETTGLDHNFSQILQIALVFTDSDLNVLSSKKLECRRSPWVVPSPGALLTTGFIPDDLKNSKNSHYEMMREVNGWLRGQHWPVTFIGYNSIGFDEPLLAQNFHQNLLDAKLTSSKNDANNQYNGRGDVITLVKATAMYMPGVLKLDIMNNYGTPSLSLLNVARQNGVILSDDDAHDAMNDIKATIGVAKLLQKAAPEIWSQMMALSTEDGVNAFLDAHEVFTCANAKNKPVVAASLTGRGAGSAHAVFDLSFDPSPYLKMTGEQLKEALLSKDRQNPFVLIRKENQPVLMPLELSANVLPAGYDEKLYAMRAKNIQADKAFLAKAESALAHPGKPVFKNNRLPEMMIDKEISAPVRKRLDQWAEEFHRAASWHDAAALVDGFYKRFKDDIAAEPSISRFVKFAGRIVYEHAPEELSHAKQEAMKKHIAVRLLNPDPDVPYMTVAKARRELEQIEKERGQGGKKWAHVTDGQIRSLKLYYTSMEKEYAAHVPAPVVNDNAPAQPAAKKSFNGGIKPKLS